MDDSLSVEGVYNLPRRPSEFGRDVLPSVFEEGDQEKNVNSLPAVQKVQVSGFWGIREGIVLS